MSDVTLQFAWKRADQRVERGARAFWHDLKVLTPEEIEERARELCAVAYADGRVVAASTGALFDYPRLRSRFIYYRTMVAPDFRRQRLASKLCSYSRKQLTAWARENPEEKVQGLFIVIQAQEFRGRQHVPVAKQLDFELVLVGYTPSGVQMRVVWFEEATVE